MKTTLVSGHAITPQTHRKIHSWIYHAPRIQATIKKNMRLYLDVYPIPDDSKKSVGPENVPHNL